VKQTFKNRAACPDVLLSSTNFFLKCLKKPLPNRSAALSRASGRALCQSIQTFQGMTLGRGSQATGDLVVGCLMTPFALKAPFGKPSLFWNLRSDVRIPFWNVFARWIKVQGKNALSDISGPRISFLTKDTCMCFAPESVVTKGFQP
jgi:hypothetical protein